jgi:hypothetical protein
MLPATAGAAVSEQAARNEATETKNPADMSSGAGKHENPPYKILLLN